MKSKIIILFARSWSLVDDKTGDTRSGVSIQYVMNDTLKPVSDSQNTSLGYQVVKESISNEVASKLDAVPGLYEAEFSLKGSAGKNVLHVSDVSFISELVKK